MSDGAETQITSGGSTAGLRQAAQAKRQAQPAAPPAQAKGDPAKAPAHAPKSTPSADAVGDADARARHRKLPTRERAEQAAEPEDDAAIAALAGDESTPGEETIRIGDHEIPISVLEQLPDEALRRIKRKLKAGGRELEVTLADALEAVPRAEGWQRKMWEAGQRAKQVDAIAQRFLSDPIGAAEKLAELTGISRADARAKLEGALLERYRYEGMDPEERARVDRQRELEAKAARADELEARDREAAAEREIAQHRTAFVRQMGPALEAAGVRPSEHAIARMALALDAALRDGVITGEPTASHFRWAAEQVAKERKAERDAELPEDADGDTLIELLGDKRARQIARAYAKRVAKAAPPVQRSGAPRAPKPQGDGKPKTWREFQERANAAARARDRARGRG